ncbi:uncharacterized protein CC84DRAFT_606634 [Paraphaeosphaeria sporulosa]|uniref:Uncharacterized protein n=1 Tax=Paraphaeosphaeria sporulosa TaxID=1460663 RepID=A0A177CNJ0_9PLEO|nr:uncharacterized protein CC84DRAFT_606634 [Paraphaeosphaeria sporulosa]OAG09105.1 hypothetical protein CC84DRAFT_606634 [Paraphaeosphaeria sporulosa]
MITVDRMFQNIRDIVKTKSVTVATKKDLEGAYKKSERPESKRSVGNAGQSSQPAGDMSSTPMPVSAVINANTAPQQAQTTSVSSRTSDHPWTWSQEHSDYYKPVYGADGRLVKFVWGRATLSQTTHPLSQVSTTSDASQCGQATPAEPQAPAYSPMPQSRLHLPSGQYGLEQTDRYGPTARAQPSPHQQPAQYPWSIIPQSPQTAQHYEAPSGQPNSGGP